MVGGYYTEYFSTLLKSNWALAYKERWDSRRVVRYARQADKIIFTELPEKIEVEHRVTSALKDEDRAEEAIKDVIKYGLQLAFNSSYEDEIIFRTIKHILDSMLHIKAAVDGLRRNVNDASAIKDRNALANAEQELEELSKRFALTVRNQVKKAEGQAREEMKEVMNLIEQAHTVDKDTFMTAVRQKFSTLKSQSALARYAFRFDIQHEKRLINSLERLSVKLEVLKNDFERMARNPKLAVDNFRKRANEFNGLIQAHQKDIEGAFLYSYKIKKRDFNIMLTMVVNAEVLKKLDFKWIKMHYLPELPTRKKIESIDELQERLSHKLHIMAQALRISMKAEEDLGNKALPIIA